MKAVGTVAAALAFAVSGGLAGGTTQLTGLHGFVRKSPITPVCRTEACDGPAAGVTLTFSRADGLKVRAATGATGFYRVALVPGRYTITAEVRVRQTFTKKTAKVLQGRDARLDFHIDTGIQ